MSVLPSCPALSRCGSTVRVAAYRAPRITGEPSFGRARPGARGGGGAGLGVLDLVGVVVKRAMVQLEDAITPGANPQVIHSNVKKLDESTEATKIEKLKFGSQKS